VYRDLYERAAALLHALARNHPLLDGDKRLALGAAIAFLGLNGHRLIRSEGEAHDLVIAVATGDLDDVRVDRGHPPRRHRPAPGEPRTAPLTLHLVEAARWWT